MGVLVGIDGVPSSSDSPGEGDQSAKARGHPERRRAYEDAPQAVSRGEARRASLERLKNSGRGRDASGSGAKPSKPYVDDGRPLRRPSTQATDNFAAKLDRHNAKKPGAEKPGTEKTGGLVGGIKQHYEPAPAKEKTKATDKPTDDKVEFTLDEGGFWAGTHGDKPNFNNISVDKARAHILYGDGGDGNGGHRHDSGIPDKTTFPKNWEDDKIINSIKEVTRNPDSPPSYNERKDNWKIRGTYEDVRIEVIVHSNGNILTGYPIEGKGLHRNDENGEPQPL